MSNLAGSVNVSSHLCLISPQQQTKLNFQRKYHQNRSPSEGVPADSEGFGQARRTFWSEQSRATSEHHHAPHGERHPPPRQPHQDPDPTEQPALRGVHRGRAENYLNLIEKIAFGMKIAANNSKWVKLVEFWISPAIFSPKCTFFKIFIPALRATSGRARARCWSSSRSTGDQSDWNWPIRTRYKTNWPVGVRCETIWQIWAQYETYHWELVTGTWSSSPSPWPSGATSMVTTYLASSTRILKGEEPRAKWSMIKFTKHFNQ